MGTVEISVYKKYGVVQLKSRSKDKTLQILLQCGTNRVSMVFVSVVCLLLVFLFI